MCLRSGSRAGIYRAFVQSRLAAGSMQGHTRRAEKNTPCRQTNLPTERQATLHLLKLTLSSRICLFVKLVRSRRRFCRTLAAKRAKASQSSGFWLQKMTEVIDRGVPMMPARVSLANSASKSLRSRTYRGHVFSTCTSHSKAMWPCVCQQCKQTCLRLKSRPSSNTQLGGRKEQPK